MVRPEEKYFPMFSSKSCNNCILFPVGNLNVEFVRHSTYEGGEAGRVGLFVDNLGSGQRFAGSGPRKVTRGQL